jgi:hypothetical protein
VRARSTCAHNSVVAAFLSISDHQYGEWAKSPADIVTGSKREHVSPDAVDHHGQSSSHRMLGSQALAIRESTLPESLENWSSAKEGKTV